jgi:putative transcriptional regulator
MNSHSDGSSACERQRRVKPMRTIRHSRADLDLTKIDWARIDATSDAEIDAQIAADADTAPSFTADEILAAGRRIEPDDVVDVRTLRRRLGLSQMEFAARYGFSVDAIRQYERKRRVPSGAIRTLLTVIAREPDAVTRALAHRKSGDRKTQSS